MNQNKEIEFKTLINKEQYYALLEEFNLSNNVYTQINHYFDTKNTDLIQEQTVLRIRQKGNNFKLTKKTRALVGADETHIFLSKEKALEMLENGFDANVIGLPYQVSKVAELTTYRVSSHYKNGRIFFDRNVYYGKEDYEIEYEVSDYEKGKKDIEELLKSLDIYVEENKISKVKRALNSIKK